jgi:hypothetical protein
MKGSDSISDTLLSKFMNIPRDAAQLPRGGNSQDNVTRVQGASEGFVNNHQG